MTAKKKFYRRELRNERANAEIRLENTLWDEEIAYLNAENERLMAEIELVKQQVNFRHCCQT